MSTEWIAVGRVTRAVGLDGSCIVEPFGATLDTIELPCTVMLGYSLQSIRTFQIDDIRVRNKGLNIRFNGVSDRDAADALKGMFVYAQESALPELVDDEYYHFELKGMSVYTDVDNALIGNITDVYNFPAADTLEIQHTGGFSVLVPMNSESIVLIDRKERRVVLNKVFVEDLLQP